MFRLNLRGRINREVTVAQFLIQARLRIGGATHRADACIGKRRGAEQLDGQAGDDADAPTERNTCVGRSQTTQST